MMASGSECLEVIPLFDDTDESYSINNFFEIFEAVADQLQWKSDEKVSYLKIQLQGEARNYVTAINSEDYATLKKCLIERFSVKDNIRKLCAVANLPQPADMPVEKFIEKVESMCLMIASKQTLNGCHSDLLKSRIERDILLSKMNPQIIEGVIQRNPKNLKQIKEFAILEEKKINAAKHNQKEEISTARIQPQTLQGTGQRNPQAVKHTERFTIFKKNKIIAAKHNQNTKNSTTIIPQIHQGSNQRYVQTQKRVKEFSILDRKKLNGIKFVKPETTSPTTPENVTEFTDESLYMSVNMLKSEVEVMADNLDYLKKLLDPNIDFKRDLLPLINARKNAARKND